MITGDHTITGNDDVFDKAQGATVRFRVLADGCEVFDSGPMNETSAARQISLEVSEVKRLVLWALPHGFFYSGDLQGEPAHNLYICNHGARVAGVPIGAYCRSGELMADAQYRAWRIYGEVAVRAPGTGPFSLAGHLMGAESFLMELALADRDPGGPAEQALRHLLEMTTEALIRFAAACLEAGADLVQAGDSLGSLDMISPAMYRRWAWPAERKFFATIHPLAAGEFARHDRGCPPVKRR